MPADLANSMADAGLFRMLVPEVYGGSEVHPQDFFDALVATSQADGAVGWVHMIASTTALMSASLPEHHARAMYLDDPNTITVGVTAPIGRAKETEGGGLQVTGRWPFGSGSQVAKWICGGCMIEENGELRKNDRGVAESLLVFFPADEVTIHDGTWQTSGLRGTGSHDIEVVQASVPEGRWAVLGKRARIDTPLYRFPTLGLLALGVSAVSIGIARCALEEFMALATDKTPTGSARSLANRPSVQKDVSQCVALIESAQAFTRQVIDEAWQTAIAEGRLSTTVKARLRLAATNNAWSAVEAVDKLYHAGGGTSIYLESRLQRCFRDVHVPTQHIMVAQPTLEVVGKVQLGIDPKQPL